MPITRVRVTTGAGAFSASNAAVSATATFPAAPAGNMLVAAFAMDKNAGTITGPTGWTLLGSVRTGASISMAVYWKISTGSETSAAIKWTTGDGGAVWVIAEYTGVNQASPWGPLDQPTYSDIATTSLSLNPPAATASSAALAFFAIDSVDAIAGTDSPEPTSFRPQAPGFTWATTAFGSDNSMAALALSENLSVATGQDIAPTTFTWTRGDQATGLVALLQASGFGQTTNDSLPIAEAVTTTATNDRGTADALGIRESVIAGLLYPMTTSDVLDAWDAAQVTRGPIRSDRVGGADAVSLVQSGVRAPNDEAAIREDVKAELVFGQIQDFQFLFDVQPRVAFGHGQAVEVTTFDPGSADLRSQDVDSPVGDYRVFGTDRKSPPVWAWSMWTNTYSPADALNWIDLLTQVWDNDVRQTPGGVLALAYTIAGRRRRVYGRPRRFTPVPDRIQFGRIHIEADFSLAEDTYYDDEEQGVTLAMRVDPAASSGLVLPARVPWRFTSGPAPRTDRIEIQGSKPTWVTPVFTGPVANPWVTIGDMTFGLVGSIGQGETVTLSGRPWDAGVRRSDGAWVPQMLDPRSRLSALQLSPGQYSVTYGGTDNTGASRCSVHWRNAHRSL